MRNQWLDGIMGVAVGDALGMPAQFRPRSDFVDNPITGMEYCENFDVPAGTWSDDTSMTLAMLDSIHSLRKVDADDVAGKFVEWLYDGKYGPFGKAIDIGLTCETGIVDYKSGCDVYTCGKTGGRANGNGSLMRTMPVCLWYAIEEHEGRAAVDHAISDIHLLGGLTHNHIRAKMACGLYFFCVRELLYGEGSLKERLQKGLDRGFAYYEGDIANRVELSRYGRLRDLTEFATCPESDIKTSGYVVDSLEAAIWGLITTESYKECELKLVNLGDDADTVGAIAGGLAGLYYGYDSIPTEWLDVIVQKEYIESLCEF